MIVLARFPQGIPIMLPPQSVLRSKRHYLCDQYILAKDPHLSITRPSISEQASAPRTVIFADCLASKSKPLVVAEMIETKSDVISQQVAEEGCSSLDREVTRKREEGKLDPGQRTVEYLSWTTETYKAAQEFESSLDLTGLDSLSVTTSEASGIKWVGPFIYGDVLKESLRYPASASGDGVIGILALSDLYLPDVGDSTGLRISGGSVAYFRTSDRVVYKSCSGRGILFHISN